MTLPQVNARLKSIVGPGGSEDYDYSGDAGAPKWEGDIGAYVTEKVQTSTAQGRLDRFKRTTVIIPGDLRPPVDLQQGDTLTYDYAGVTFTRKVREFQAHLLAGMPATVRIDVEDQ